METIKNYTVKITLDENDGWDDNKIKFYLDVKKYENYYFTKKNKKYIIYLYENKYFKNLK